jgi:hypothetical protein
MHDILTKVDQETLLGLCGMLLGALGIIGGITVAIVKVVSSHYRRTQLDEMEATLKMEMIQRGMSADEIDKVLGARMSINRPTTLAEFLGGLPQIKMPAFGKTCEKR